MDREDSVVASRDQDARPQTEANASATPFTPGPWRASTFQVYADLDRIAHTGMGQLPPRRSGEAVANARLIAAAPDLLALAKAFEAWEARVIQHGDWSRECVLLTPDLHEEWLQLAAQRNRAVDKAKGVAITPDDTREDAQRRAAPDLPLGDA
jgi:hypothetical protein